MKKEIAYLEIGGNIEDRIQYLINTKILIKKHLGEILQSSSVYETPPWGFEADHNFLNQTLKIETTLSPEILINKIIIIEEKLGRVRSGDTYCSRTVDIDILFYGERIVNEENLQIPHPKMQLRKFVLLPLSEIATDLIHPILKKNIATLLLECNDESSCTKLQ